MSQLDSSFSPQRTQRSQSLSRWWIIARFPGSSSILSFHQSGELCTERTACIINKNIPSLCSLRSLRQKKQEGHYSTAIFRINARPKRARRAKSPRRPRRVALRSHPIFSFQDLPVLPAYTLPTISVLRSEISPTSVTVVSEIMMRNNFEAAMDRAHGRAGARPSRFTSVTLNCTPPKSPHSATRRGRRGYFARRAPHTKNARHRKGCTVSREGRAPTPPPNGKREATRRFGTWQP